MSGDFLGQIIARKRRENARRRVLMERWPLVPALSQGSSRREAAERCLQRPKGASLRVIAEVKMRSPSAGLIRTRSPGAVQAIARSYASSGASAISVLCDRPGFGGSPLDLRRAASAVAVPLLFKEFVLEEMQLDLARAAGASMALLLARALSQPLLCRLVQAALDRDLAPVVEAADEQELARSLATGARIVGVNARDLRTFKVDPARAVSLVEAIPADRIAVSMSGVKDSGGFAQIAAGRADAVLIGEAFMRANDPGEALASMRAHVCGTRTAGPTAKRWRQVDESDR